MSIASFPQQLRLAVTSLNDSQLDTAYRPERWTIRQVMNHCGDNHMNAYIKIEWAFTESNPGGITFIEKEITNPGISPYDIN